jgi:uncharacterized damage-inducible protein DinB
MQMLPALNEMIDHNYWARDRQMEACGALSEEQLLRPLGGSFASVRDTLAHLLAVEWIWLERWRGRSPRQMPAEFQLPTVAAISQRWHPVERDMRAFISELSEEALAAPMSCTSTRGEQWTYPLWHMIAHLLNHQSFHRGQVTHQLRQLGVEPPRIDLLVALDMGRVGRG